jgi:hypothetical protein
LKKSFLQRPDARPDAASDTAQVHHCVRSSCPPVCPVIPEVFLRNLKPDAAPDAPLSTTASGRGNHHRIRSSVPSFRALSNRTLSASGHSRSLLECDRTLPPPRPVIRPPRPVITLKADLTLFNRTIGSQSRSSSAAVFTVSPTSRVSAATPSPLQAPPHARIRTTAATSP